jgi:gliding motility-associated-like protein
MKIHEVKVLGFSYSVIVTLIITFGVFPNILKAQNCSVFAGNDTTICWDQKMFLNGNYSDSINGGISWSQVSGPNVTIADSTDLKTEITDFTEGNSYTFKLSARCIDDSTVYDEVTIFVGSVTIASAGPDTTYCSGTHTLEANAPLGINEIGEWSGSVAGISVDDINDPNSIITLLSSTSGFITLTWTITDTITQCTTSDDVKITNGGWRSLVFAGPNEAICFIDSFEISDARIDSNHDSLLWTSSGTGSFNDLHLVNPTYQPSAVDILNGEVTLTLTVFGITECGDTTSDMILRITEDPLVSAGSDTLICSSVGAYGLAGNANNYSTLLWQTSGSGSFDNHTILDAHYIPGATDIAYGRVELFLTAYGNGTCQEVTDTMTLNILKGPTVYAGKDAIICPGDAYQILDAEVYNFNSFVWTHNGNGVLQNPNNMSPTYISGDNENAIVNIILTATQPDTNTCVVAIDSMQLLISGNPVVICPSQNIFVYNNSPGKCGYTVTDNSLDALGNVDCGGVTVSHNFNSWGNPNSLKGATFPVDTTVVVWTARDPFGNTDSCSITVVVNDNEDPIFVNCPARKTFTINLFPGTCESIANWNIPIATDNCSGVNVVQSYGPPLGSVIVEGNYLIEYQATDASGNYTYCNFSIEVVDTEEPVIICQPDLTKESDSGSCTWTSTRNSLSPLYVNSNCDIVLTWEVINPDNSVATGFDDLSGYVFQQGMSKVRYLVEKEDNQQSSECSFSVTVVVNQAPEIICQKDTVIDAASGECSAEIELTPPGIVDSCSSLEVEVKYRVFNPDNSVSETIPDTTFVYDFQAGTSRVEWLLNDQTICFQNIRVIADNESLIPDAGPNSTICEIDSFYITEASAPLSESVKWTTGGTGMFLDPTSVNTVYIPSQLDIDNGYTILTLSTTSGCLVASDQMVLRITKSPFVSAGGDAIICDSENARLSGNVSESNATVIWFTSGTGTFSNPEILNPIYYPGEDDIESGNVKLIILANGEENCGFSSDTMNLDIVPGVVINAGEDSWVCERSSYYLADASVSHSVEILWTTNGTGVFDDPTLINATYTPGASDVMQGQVVLTVSNMGLTSCGSESDNLILSISKKPTADAGDNISSCSNQPVQINKAFAKDYSSVYWTHNGMGELQYENPLSPTYVPFPDETGLVTLQMHVVGNEACIVDTLTEAIQLEIFDGLNIEAQGDTAIFSNTSAKLSVKVENGSGLYFFNWQPATDVNNPNSGSTETRNLSTNTTFNVTVTDAKTGCIATDEIMVKINENPDALVEIYNALSPNGDGVNDKWIIDGIEKFPNNEVFIYNRWGDVIRQFRNYDNESVVWNGTGEKDEKLIDGTYYYVLKLADIKSYTGWVQIRSNQ